MECNTCGAKLEHAILIGARLVDADLSNTIMINISHENVEIDNLTAFYGAIIDDPDFIDNIKNYTFRSPEKIKNKRELKVKLEHKEQDKGLINYCMEVSKLPR